MAIDDTVTLKKLEIFLAYMDLNNMARVSAVFGQSAVSIHRAIHSLEEALQCPLFRREGRNLIPLERAFTFAEYAKRSIREFKEGVREIHEAVGFNGGRLNVGTNYSLTLQCIPQLLTALKRRKPNVDVELTMDSNQHLIESLVQGRLDAIIVGLSSESEDTPFISVPLFCDQMFLAAPLNSPYTGAENLDLSALRDEKFLTLTEGFASTAFFEQCCRRADISPNTVMRVKDIFSLINLVSGGIGYSILPGRIAGFSPRIELIALNSKYALRQRVSMLVLKTRERDPNLLALAAECRMYARTSEAQQLNVETA